MSPFKTALLEKMCDMVLGSIAHPLRGIIIEVPDDSTWYGMGGSRAVTVQATPSGASYPKRYSNVPWNNLAHPDQMQGKPNVGDYVTIVFKGGSSEFPVVSSYHPGSVTAAQMTTAQTTQPIVPATAINKAIQTPKNLVQVSGPTTQGSTPDLIA